MLSWLFTRKSWPTKKKHENIKRVQNMLLTPTRNIDKCYSPTLQQLKCGDIKNVKEISSIYEDKMAQENEKELGNRLAVNTPLTSRKLMPAFEKTDEKSNSEFLDLLKGILSKDKKYTDWIKKLIDSYIYELEFEARFMPEDDRNALIVSVFGNIKSIYEMHIQDFQPFIEACINDKSLDVSGQFLNFATKLTALCKDGSFHPYIMHAMIEKESITKRSNFYVYLMRYAEQKYQFSFNFDPIYQFNHYGFIFEEIYKEFHTQKVSFKCAEKMNNAMKEFRDEMAKIKSACKN